VEGLSFEHDVVLQKGIAGATGRKEKRMRKRAAWLVVGALALAGATPPQLSPLSATTVAGQQVSLAQDHHEVVIVHFWATWCAPCRLEMPILDAAWRKYDHDGVQVIGIALDAGASRQKIAGAATGVGFPLARLGDTNLRQRDVPKALPETLIYGRDGRLRYRFQAGGAMLDAATLDRIIPPLIAER
jgi:thiol-disulfide isomerase/thioredoxin